MMRHVYFLGIGGIGMSALARWFKAQGAEVAGYDRQPSTLTRALVEEGITVDHTGSPEHLPGSLRQETESSKPDHWTIVWTPAIPADFPLLNAFREAGFTLHKRAEILGNITRNKPLLAVAGTHGKTTTSTLLAHRLQYAALPVDAFLGGIAQRTGTNLLLADRNSKDPWIVVEADEYDQSFLTLSPKYAVITSVDPDHLDIYGDHANMLEAFVRFIGQVEPRGVLLHSEASEILESASPSVAMDGLNLYGELKDNVPLEETGWRAAYSHVGHEAGQARFLLHFEDRMPEVVHWRLPGAHNAANATAAAYMAIRAGMDPNRIPEALQAFPGVARRFEVRHRQDDLVIVDDYAHHPSEIEGTIAAARQAFPGRRITGVFQPHLFSRTQDFMTEFAASLSALDDCILLPIYPAREEPIPGVDAQGIGDKMVGCRVETPSESRFLDVLEKLAPEVVLFMGAGDLHQWIEPAWARLHPEKKQDEEAHTTPLNGPEP